MADRLITLMDRWNIAKAVIVGADMGGQPALVLGAKHPERVDRLVIMNCLAFPDEKTSWELYEPLRTMNTCSLEPTGLNQYSLLHPYT